MRFPTIVVALATTYALSLACASGPAPQLDTDLVTECFGFPGRAPAPDNHASVSVRLNAGDRAVDFTLTDVDGRRHTLSQLLKTSPVLLVQGSWTCPRFQDRRGGIDELVREFEGQVQVVVVYNIEAHPPRGVPSPYKGRPRPKEFSDRDQPTTLQGRVDNARAIADHSEALVLVDHLGDGRSNPVWCTYGTCPSCSWLIDTAGDIVADHDWHDNDAMRASIVGLLDSTD